MRGLGFEIWGLGVTVQDLRAWVRVLGFEVWGLRIGVWGLEFEDLHSELRV